MIRLPYRPRWANRLWARFFGYFWLPCPTCGELFGGHEWTGPERDDEDSVVCRKDERRRHLICPQCRRAGLGGSLAPPAYCHRHSRLEAMR